MPGGPPTMKVHTLVVGAFSVNCYIVDAGNRKGMVIDPGDDAGRIAHTLRQHHIEVAAYGITHGHMDHVSALAELSRQFPAPVYIHARDARWAFLDVNAMPPYYKAPDRPGSALKELEDGQVITLDDIECRVLETPGHSPGCVCFHFPAAGMIFTGDTLFAGSVGRTDLAGGDEILLTRSLRRLVALPETTTVFPGHGPSSTIGQERSSNPFLRS